MEKGILSTPALYISCYLKMNRIEYYDRMTQVRRTGDYEQWISFSLQAFTERNQSLQPQHQQHLRGTGSLLPLPI